MFGKSFHLNIMYVIHFMFEGMILDFKYHLLEDFSLVQLFHSKNTGKRTAV